MCLGPCDILGLVNQEDSINNAAPVDPCPRDDERFKVDCAIAISRDGEQPWGVEWTRTVTQSDFSIILEQHHTRLRLLTGLNTFLPASTTNLRLAAPFLTPEAAGILAYAYPRLTNLTIVNQLVPLPQVRFTSGHFLSDLRAPNLSTLELRGICLYPPNTEALVRRFPSLKKLVLRVPCEYPLGAVAFLGRLPLLEQLELDACFCCCGSGPHEADVRVQMADQLRELFRAARPDLRLKLLYIDDGGDSHEYEDMCSLMHLLPPEIAARVEMVAVAET